MLLQDVKISEDNILSDIMSDLDGSAPSSVVKPKPLVATKSNIVETTKREAQNYFKNLSTSVKKPTPVVRIEETPPKVIKNIKVSRNITAIRCFKY